MKYYKEGTCSKYGICNACCQSYIGDSNMCRSCILTNSDCDTKNNMCNPAGGCEGVSDKCCQFYVDKEGCSVCTATQSK